MVNSKWRQRQIGESGISKKTFSKEEMHTTKLDKIEKNVSIKIQRFQVE
ncbi:1720_t:CDS:2 [Funneliformis geosporum]|nr:1720_t:CDS:2 [Funneliformis geosporum]